MATTQFTLFITYVSTDGPFIKLSGQLDKPSAFMVNEIIQNSHADYDINPGPVPERLEGAICVAKYQDDKYYRARITKVIDRLTGLVNVHFLDYGNVEVITLNKISFLRNNDRLLTVPVLASDFYLSGIISNEDKWYPDQITKLNKLLNYFEFKVFQHPTKVPLISINYQNNSLSTHLLSFGFGQSISLGEQETALLTMLETRQTDDMALGDLMKLKPPIINKGVIKESPIYPTSSAVKLLGALKPKAKNKQMDFPLSIITQTDIKLTKLPSPPDFSKVVPPTIMSLAPTITSDKVPTFKTKTLKIHSMHSVRVTHVEEGISNFTVQLVSDSSALKQMMNEINKRPYHSLQESPTIGQVCLGRSSNVIYRTIVSSVSSRGCKLYFVDFGGEELVQYYDMFVIPLEFINQSLFAIKMCLSDSNNIEWTPNLNESFKAFVATNILTLRVVPAEGPPLVQYGELYYSNRPILELLVEGGKLRSLDILPAGSTEAVLVSYVDSCVKLFLQPVARIEALQSVMEAVKQHCATQKSPGALPAGMECCARFPDDGNWYRARVLEPRGERTLVSYVDYGNEHEVEVADLRTITPALLQLPAIAIKCALTGFETKSDDIQASNQLESLVLEKTFTAHVVGKLSDDTMIANLVDDNVFPPLDISKAVTEAIKSIPSAKDTQEISKVTAASPSVNISTQPQETSNVLKKIFIPSKCLKYDAKPWDGTGKVFRNKERDIPDNVRRDKRPNIDNTNWRDRPDTKMDRTDMKSVHKLMKTATYDATINIDKLNDDKSPEINDTPPQIEDKSPQRVDRQPLREALNAKKEAQINTQPNNNNTFHKNRNYDLIEDHVKPLTPFPTKAMVVKELPNPVPLETTYKEQIIQPNSKHEVFVAWLISPSSFYVQISSLLKQFLKMMEQIPILYKGIKPFNGAIFKGASVLAKYPKDGVLYRATILACRPDAKFHVQYIDFGNKYTVNAEDIWQLDEQLMDVPKMALHCCLLGVLPRDGEWKANSDIDSCFNAARYQCVFQHETEEAHQVSMWNNEVSVADTLIEKELAVTPQEPAVLIKDEPIYLTMLVGQSILGRVTHVESVDKLFVQLDIAKADLVESILANYDRTLLTPLPAPCVVEGQHCLVMQDNRVRRAILLSPERAALSDLGGTAEVTADQLKILPPELSVYYYQSLECRLRDRSTLVSPEELTGNKRIVYVDSLEGVKLVVSLSCPGGPEASPLCPLPVFSSNLGLAYISHQEHLRCLYLQRAADTSAVAQLLEHMYSFYQEGTPEDLTRLEPYGLCAALSSDSNWYRAIILSVTDNDCKIKFPDYGNTEIVSKASIKKLDSKFYEPSYFALRVSLGLVELHDNALSMLTEWTTDKEMQVTLAAGENGWLAKLHVNEVDLGSKLVDDKFAVFEQSVKVLNEKIRHDPLQPQRSTENYQETTLKNEIASKQPVLLPDGCTKAYINHIDTPGQFWLQSYETVDELNKIQTVLQENSDTYSEVKIGELGMLCVAKYSADDQWYRAEILDFDSDIVTVRFIDYGNTDVVNNKPDMLKRLPDDLKKPDKMSIKCSVNAVPTGSGQWTKSASEYFTNLIGDISIPVDALIVLKDITTYVDIFVNGHNLTNKLVAEGHAIRSEEPKCGDLPTCFASHVNSPSEFWIQLETAGSELQAMDSAMAEADKFPQLIIKKEGVLCAAKYSEDGAWYRAQIVANLPEATEVIFIDYGNTTITTDVRSLPFEFKSKPALSKKCSLEKPRSIKTWSCKSEILFNELTASGAEVFTIKFIAFGDKCIVELFQDGTSVTAQLAILCDPTPEINHENGDTQEFVSNAVKELDDKEQLEQKNIDNVQKHLKITFNNTAVNENEIHGSDQHCNTKHERDFADNMQTLKNIFFDGIIKSEEPSLNDLQASIKSNEQKSEETLNGSDDSRNESKTLVQDDFGGSDNSRNELKALIDSQLPNELSLYLSPSVEAGECVQESNLIADNKTNYNTEDHTQTSNNSFNGDDLNNLILGILHQVELTSEVTDFKSNIIYQDDTVLSSDSLNEDNTETIEGFVKKIREFPLTSQDKENINIIQNKTVTSSKSFIEDFNVSEIHVEMSQETLLASRDMEDRFNLICQVKTNSINNVDEENISNEDHKYKEISKEVKLASQVIVHDSNKICKTESNIQNEILNANGQGHANNNVFVENNQVKLQDKTELHEHNEDIIVQNIHKKDVNDKDAFVEKNTELANFETEDKSNIISYDKTQSHKGSYEKDKDILVQDNELANLESEDESNIICKDKFQSQEDYLYDKHERQIHDFMESIPSKKSAELDYLETESIVICQDITQLQEEILYGEDEPQINDKDVFVKSTQKEEFTNPETEDKSNIISPNKTQSQEQSSYEGGLSQINNKDVFVETIQGKESTELKIIETGDEYVILNDNTQSHEESVYEKKGEGQINDQEVFVESQKESTELANLDSAKICQNKTQLYDESLFGKFYKYEFLETTQDDESTELAYLETGDESNINCQDKTQSHKECFYDKDKGQINDTVFVESSQEEKSAELANQEADDESNIICQDKTRSHESLYEEDKVQINNQDVFVESTQDESIELANLDANIICQNKTQLYDESLLEKICKDEFLETTQKNESIERAYLETGDESNINCQDKTQSHEESFYDEKEGQIIDKVFVESLQKEESAELANQEADDESNIICQDKTRSHESLYEEDEVQINNQDVFVEPTQEESIELANLDADIICQNKNQLYDESLLKKICKDEFLETTQENESTERAYLETGDESNINCQDKMQSHEESFYDEKEGQIIDKVFVEYLQKEESAELANQEADDESNIICQDKTRSHESLYEEDEVQINNQDVFVESTQEESIELANLDADITCQNKTQLYDESLLEKICKDEFLETTQENESTERAYLETGDESNINCQDKMQSHEESFYGEEEGQIIDKVFVEFLQKEESAELANQEADDESNIICPDKRQSQEEFFYDEEEGKIIDKVFVESLQKEESAELANQEADDESNIICQDKTRSHESLYEEDEVQINNQDVFVESTQEESIELANLDADIICQNKTQLYDESLLEKICKDEFLETTQENESTERAYLETGDESNINCQDKMQSHEESFYGEEEGQIIDKVFVESLQKEESVELANQEADDESNIICQDKTRSHERLYEEDEVQINNQDVFVESTQEESTELANLDADIICQNKTQLYDGSVLEKVCKESNINCQDKTQSHEESFYDEEEGQIIDKVFVESSPVEGSAELANQEAEDESNIICQDKTRSHEERLDEENEGQVNDEVVFVKSTQEEIDN